MITIFLIILKSINGEKTNFINIPNGIYFLDALIIVSILIYNLLKL
jgi:hypothetical protein